MYVKRYSLYFMYRLTTFTIKYWYCSSKSVTKQNLSHGALNQFSYVNYQRYVSQNLFINFQDVKCTETSSKLCLRLSTLDIENFGNTRLSDAFFPERIILMSWKPCGGSTVINIQNPPYVQTVIIFCECL